MDAIIGGSNLTRLPNLDTISVKRIKTPFGETSGPVTIGVCAGAEVAFLPRHGDPHALAPHKINFRANIWALKELGVRHVVAIATSGGIRAEFGPAVLVVPDQLIDYTHGRDNTYFDGTGDEPVRHVDFTQPYGQTVRERILAAAAEVGETAHDGGCYGCFNGPRLETAAEIRRLARDGCDLVGQTGMPEAVLARELGVDYAALCPIVNFAAGIGDSKKEVSREEITRTRLAALERVAKILSAFVTQNVSDAR